MAKVNHTRADGGRATRRLFLVLAITFFSGLLACGLLPLAQDDRMWLAGAWLGLLLLEGMWGVRLACMGMLDRKRAFHAACRRLGLAPSDTGSAGILAPRIWTYAGLVEGVPITLKMSGSGAGTTANPGNLIVNVQAVMPKPLPFMLRVTGRPDLITVLRGALFGPHDPCSADDFRSLVNVETDQPKAAEELFARAGVRAGILCAVRNGWTEIREDSVVLQVNFDDFCANAAEWIVARARAAAALAKSVCAQPVLADERVGAIDIRPATTTAAHADNQKIKAGAGNQEIPQVAKPGSSIGSASSAAHIPMENRLRREFGFLENEFGCRLVEREDGDLHYGLHLTFINTSTGVRLSWVPADATLYVFLIRLIEGRIPPYPLLVRADTDIDWVEIRDVIAVTMPVKKSKRQIKKHGDAAIDWKAMRHLVRVACPEVKRPSRKRHEAPFLAWFLRTHASGVLRGDFSVFGQAARRIRERTHRRR